MIREINKLCNLVKVADGFGGVWNVVYEVVVKETGKVVYRGRLGSIKCNEEIQKRILEKI